MKKLMLIIVFIELICIKDVFGKSDLTIQAGVFGLFPPKEISCEVIGSNDFLKSAFGANLKFGVYSVYGNWGGNVLFYMGGVAIYNTNSNLPEINKIEKIGKHFQIQLNVEYSLFQRRYLTPYFSLGVGVPLFDVNYSKFYKEYNGQIKTENYTAGFLSGVSINLGTGVYIPIDRHFEGYLFIQSPAYYYNLFPDLLDSHNENELNFPYINLCAGLSFKLRD